MVEPYVGIGSRRCPSKTNHLLTATIVSVPYQRKGSGRFRTILCNVTQPTQLEHVGRVVAHQKVINRRGRAHVTSHVPIQISRFPGVTKVEVVANFMHLGCDITAPLVVVDTQPRVRPSIGQTIIYTSWQTVHENSVGIISWEASQLSFYSHCSRFAGNNFVGAQGD
jgi:hypothetical protein